MERSHYKTKLLHGQRGNTAILFALCLPVLLGCAALAVDLARLNMVKVELQNAADAAALAGASSLIKVGSYQNWSVAETTANSVAKQNYANAALIQDENVSTDSGYWNIPNRSYSPSHVSILAGNVPAIRVTVSIGSLNLFFGRFLGTNGPNDKPVSARAIAIIPYPGVPFDYALFSGSTSNDLNISGNNLPITGSVHTNRNLNFSGNNNSITGTAEAYGNVTISGNNNSIGAANAKALGTINTPGNNNHIIGSSSYNASIISMPDYSASIAAAAAATSQTYTGSQTISGNNIASKSIYVHGNVTVSGNNFTGIGAVMADNNITISGNNVISDDNSQICFYSKNGNITISGNNFTLNGVLYAPNGTISVSGNNITVKGTIVGNNINVSGNNFEIDRTDDPITSLQGRAVQLVQ